MKLIELEHLVKSYGGVSALNGLSLQVPKGSLFGLLGPNGSGKTTTLRIISTLLSPDSGKVKVAGFDALKDPNSVRRALGYVAQEVAIDKILTGREMLDLQADLYHLDRDSKLQRIEYLTSKLDMNSWINRRCGSFSGGMKRRIDLAAGMLHNPQLLILDEPTVGLDIESRSAIWNLLREQVEQGTTVLLSSHYLEEVEALSTHMAIIDNGRVIAQGSPDQLKKQLGGDRVTLRVREFSDERESEIVRKLLSEINGVRQVVVNKAQGFSLNLFVDNEEVLPNLREKLNESNFEVFALSQSRPSLDDVYLQATGRTLMDAELDKIGTRDAKSEMKQSMR